MKKILYILLVVILVFFLIINLFTIFHISFLGLRLFRVGSGSMTPYLVVNDYILVKTNDKYEVGDVITYKIKEKEYVTHRIINIDDENIITKGDANNTQDEPTKKENIIGKVIVRFRILGFILTLFMNPVSWILTFTMIFLIKVIFNKKEV